MRGALLLLLACACAPADDEGAALERLRVAVRARDPGLLFDALDADSRGAVDTIWRYQKQAAEVAAGFPPEPRARELRRLDLATAAPDVRAFFAAWVATRDPWRRPEAADVLRVKGRWGCARWRDELLLAKDAAANDVGRLKENAAVYRKSW